MPTYSLLGSIFAVDLRSLALFRVALGLVSILTFSSFIYEAETFFGSQGLLPPSLALSYGNQFRSSFLIFLNSELAVIALASIGLALSALLIFNYSPNLTSLGLWILFVAFINRNSLITQGGDQLLNALLFFSCFLPFRQAAVQKPANAKGYLFFSYSTAALYLQVCCLYWVAVATRTSDQWWSLNSALRTALGLDMFATQIGRLILQHSWLPEALTWATMRVEIAGPILLLISCRFAWLRLAVIATFLMFHLGILLAMNLLHFSLCASALWLVFLPGSFWFYVKRVSPKVYGIFDFPQKSARRADNFYRLRELLKKIIVLTAIAALVAWNILVACGNYPPDKLPRAITAGIQLVRLDQSWTLFAPWPWSDNIVLGAFGDGPEHEMELVSRSFWPINDGRIRPYNFLTRERWAKYTVNLKTYNHSRLFRMLAIEICNKYNRRVSRENRIKSVKLVVFRYKALSSGEIPADAATEHLASVSCPVPW